MNTAKYISELLYQHNCVIVPHLGGFVANYASAKIHPTQHTFEPPSKKIVFNKNLSTNDGLLANHISRSEKISYDKALSELQLFASETLTQLKSGKKVELENVGTLFLDVERNIQFKPSPTNYLPEAFGLPTFQSPAIKRDNIGKRIEKEFKDRDAIPAEKKKINYKRIAAMAVLIPFVIGLVWIPFKTDLLNNVNYSNLNPFAKKDITTPVVLKPATKQPAPAIEPVPEALVSDSITTNTSTTIEPVAASLVEQSKPDTTRVQARAIIEESDLPYHLVTGCFQIEENAVNFVQTLRDQNLPASIIGMRNGLYVVSCGNYATKEEAYRHLDVLKNSQPNAWLLKN